MTGTGSHATEATQAAETVGETHVVTLLVARQSDVHSPAVMETTSLAVTVKAGLLVAMVTSSPVAMAITNHVVMVRDGPRVVMAASSHVVMVTSNRVVMVRDAHRVEMVTSSPVVTATLSLAVMARAGLRVVTVISSLVVTATTAAPSASTTMSVNARLRRVTASTVVEPAASVDSQRPTATISGPCAPRTRTLRCLVRLHPKTFTRRLATS